MTSDINKNLRALIENHNAKEQRKPIICLEGSARSGKTWSVLEFLIFASVAMPGIVSTIFRFDAARHDEAAIRDFTSIMLSDKYKPFWDHGKWNATLKRFEFENKSIIEFKGMKDASKLHGPERDIAFINETMEAHYDSYRQILARTRLCTIMDWNPSLNKHWVFDRVMGRDDVLYMHSTYLDNPHLSSKIVHEIEATEPTDENRRQGTADNYFWEVYGLGKRAKREGAIFKEYWICEPGEWPQAHMCQRHGYGLDFGFSADPAALIECALFQSRLYVRQIVYETGLITCKSHANPRTPSLQGSFEAAPVQKNSKIVADSARPEQIAELNAEGYCITSVKKYKGSVVAGIDLMQRFPIYVHRHSNDIQEELQQYSWRRNPAGVWLNEPEDRFNHACDAIRYWVQDELPRMAVERGGAGRSRVARRLKRY